MNKIAKTNNLYKKSIRIALKKNRFCPFRYEKQMDFLFAELKKDFSQGKPLKVLESGCGQGRLLYYLQKFDSRQNYFGLDYVKENVDYAKKLFCRESNIKIQKGNFYHFGNRQRKAFDLVISYKTLSWLPEYKRAVKEMIRVAKDKVYITSLFYDGDISFEIKVNNLNQKCFNYLNVYSTNEFRKFCLKNGAKKVTFHYMKLDIDLPKPTNPNDITTYTVRARDGENMEITGVVLLNWKLVIVQL